MRVKRVVLLFVILIVGIFIREYAAETISYYKKIRPSDKIDMTELEKEEIPLELENVLNPYDVIELTLDMIEYNEGFDELYYTVKNNSGEEVIFGEHYIIERYKNNKWYVVPFRDDIAFNGIGYVVSSNGEHRNDIWLEALYRPLGSGRYRLIKHIDSGYYSVEFRVIKY